MANLIPSLSSCSRRMTSGERRFAQRLTQLLDDDYLCWYEPRVGEGVRQRYADFVIVHPQRGLLLLEVKDWKPDTIQQMDKAACVLQTEHGLKTVSNPLEQARQCAYKLVNQLEKDPQLIRNTGRYQGKLLFPYGYGVVLTNITRNQFENADMELVLPWNRTLCRDEMLESTDSEDFQQCLWNMFDYQFEQPLNAMQLDRLRWHIFPEIRINSLQRDLFTQDNTVKPATEQVTAVTCSTDELPDQLKVMDMQQEKLARSLGTGHRVIHGVAGSGKTLILGYRCMHLARVLNKPILVLCYNITLAARLRVWMQEKGIADKVSVFHFHDWCGELSRRYYLERPTSQGPEYIEQLVENVITAVDTGYIPKGQYGAILIDEGHDFEAEWLKLSSDMVDEDSDSLLLLYDDAQSIYQNRKALNFSLSSVGIQARGRTTVLRLNYRNTDEVFGFAYRFARHYMQPQEGDDDHVPLIEPHSAGRHSVDPQLRIFADFQQEVDTIARWLQHWHQQQAMPWMDMCITYRYAAQGKALFAALQARDIPCQWLRDRTSKTQFDPYANSVKLMTIHSSKGLEFPLVVVAGIGFMAADPEADLQAAEAKLLYVAMTRSTDKLLLTSHRETDFTRALCGEEVLVDDDETSRATTALAS